jgi:hypothetical protein
MPTTQGESLEISAIAVIALPVLTAGPADLSAGRKYFDRPPEDESGAGES